MDELRNDPPANRNQRRTAGTPQSRHWLLTIPVAAWGPPYLPPECSYIVGQLELAPTTGYTHWQVYVIFKTKRRMGTVKNTFGNQAHCEVARDPSAADAYCQKEDSAIAGTRFQLGEKPFDPSSSADWVAVKSAAKEGRLDDIPPEVFVRHYSSLRRIAKDYMVAPPSLESVCGVWIHGPPGVGKSHKARVDYPNAYDKMCNKWWDGYQNEEYVLIDDFDKNHSGLGHHLKRWADKYPFTAESKGHAVSIRPKKIIVTSNYRIEDIFDDLLLVEALKRRFHPIFVALRLF